MVPRRACAGSRRPPRLRHVDAVEGLVRVVDAGVVLLGLARDVVRCGLDRVLDLGSRAGAGGGAAD